MTEQYCVALKENWFKSFVKKMIQSFGSEDLDVTLVRDDRSTFHTNKRFL